jgi:ubiquinone/menaquinone biosynthesis C-methylase UbiE
MNKLEFWMVNNPIRTFIQDKIEIRRLRKLSSLPKGKIVLEIGCGNGTGARLIKKYFSPKEIFAVDLDRKMIELATRNNVDPSIHFEVGDASKLKHKSNQFDAVVDFGVIHHIPNWKDCLKELKRVLKPGGELILEDLSIETFSGLGGWFIKKTLKHPYEKMYKKEEFIDYLKTLGFDVIKERSHHPVIKYFVVIAKK